MPRRRENIDWTNLVITFFRHKTAKPVRLGIGKKLAEVLRRLPSSGPIFPTLCKVKEKDRGNEFRQRCQGRVNVLERPGWHSTEKRHQFAG